MTQTFGIILGEFHKKEAEIMLAAATKSIEQAGYEVAEIVWIPGSYEAPLALERLFRKKEIDAAVVLGIIERGETAHGLVMAQSVSNKILDIQLDHMKPVGMGILGPEIFPSQISARVEPYARAAAEAAIRMLGEK